MVPRTPDTPYCRLLALLVTPHQAGLARLEASFQALGNLITYINMYNPISAE